MMQMISVHTIGFQRHWVHKNLLFILKMASQRDLFEDQSQQGFENLNGEEVEDREEGEEGLVQEREANDYDPKTKKTKAFQAGELAIIVDHMDENLQILTGFCRDHEYKRKRNNAWRQLVNEINAWNDQNATGIVRSCNSVRDKVNNLKSRSK